MRQLTRLKMPFPVAANEQNVSRPPERWQLYQVVQTLGLKWHLALIVFTAKCAKTQLKHRPGTRYPPPTTLKGRGRRNGNRRQAIASMTASPNFEQLTKVALSIKRAKS